MLKEAIKKIGKTPEQIFTKQLFDYEQQPRRKNDLFDEQVKMDHKTKVDTGVFRRVDKEGNLCFMKNINGKLEVVNKIRPI